MCTFEMAWGFVVCSYDIKYISFFVSGVFYDLMHIELEKAVGN